MSSSFQQFIDQITSSARLPRQTREELSQELLSHFDAEERELQLQGLSEEKIFQTIEQRFGDTQKIARELTSIYLPMDKKTKIKWLLYALGTIFLLLYLGPSNPISMAVLLTAVSAYVLLYESPKKYNVLGVQYVLSLAVLLLFIAIPLTHESIGGGMLYGTIGFPLQFYNELVEVRRFTLVENYLYFIIDYLFFIGIASATYYLGVRKFLNRYITTFLTICAVIANILLFFWLINVFD